MASSAPIPTLRYSPGLKIRNRYLASSSPSSCSSSNSLSFGHRRGVVWSLNLCNFSGINKAQKYQSLRAQAMSTTQGNVVSPRGLTDGNNEPDHLLVLVHGILASPSDWIYVEAELKRRLGRNFLIYASSCNTYIKTFGGIDGAGKRLADEVTEVVKKKESLQRISFLAHSLGGLFARYAITVLHSPDDVCSDQSSDSLPSTGLDSNAAISSRRGRIAGLEPVNFITLATPHLGVRGRKQANHIESSNILKLTFLGGYESFVPCLLSAFNYPVSCPSDWIYVEAELKRRLGRNFLIYASSCNTYIKTFGGIDGAGKRLADEVTEVVKKKESLKRISFLAHSLGGLFARYAITVLHSPDDVCSDQSSDSLPSTGLDSNAAISSRCGRISGLEPVNFVTLVTPHLGVRGRKQLPFLFGVPILEKLAPSVASTFVGRTGSQLFLTDGKPNRPPLLLRMASDCEDGKFISALGAFRSRILYANVSYDHMVGWRTPSVRRETELCKPPRRSLDGYKHVVDVEYCPPVSSDGPNFPPEAAKAKEAAQKAPNTENTKEYHEIMEEEMIRGLQQLGWKKVDVSFHSALWPFFAHNNIHVKNEWFHNAGAGVVAHVADSLKQQEKQQDSAPFISASL